MWLLRRGMDVFESRAATLALLGAGLLLLSGLVGTFLRWQRLRHVPGPFLNSLTVWPLLKRTVRGDLHQYMKDLSDEYGPLVRIAPDEVMFTDAAIFRRVGSARGGYQKSDWYDCLRFAPGQDHLLCMRGDEERRVRKAKLASGYSAKEKKSFEAGIDKHVASLIELIERKYLSDAKHHRPMEFAHKSQYFTLDAIGEIALGEAFGFLTNDADVYDFIKITSSFFPVFGVLGAMPWLARLIFRWPLNRLLPNENDKVGFGRMIAFSTGFVNRRTAPGAERRQDMMQAFLDNGLGREELTQEVVLQIIAGSDTTASAIRFTLLHLINTPHAYAALRAEIDAVPSSGANVVSSATASGLPYLQAVIREGLRMWPPANGLAPKCVPPEGELLCGLWLPGGTKLGQNMYGIARLRSFWGEDADCFVPERWLGPQRGLEEMTTVLELVFGHGKFRCLGKAIAMMELEKVFFELLKRYDFSVVDPVRPIDLLSASVWVSSNFWLRITRRK